MTRLDMREDRPPSRAYSCAAAVLLALAGCAAPIYVRAEYDHDVDFPSWTRWTWNTNASDAAGGMTSESDHPVARRIRAIVADSLAHHGFAQSPGEAADFLVRFHTQVDRQYDVIGTPYGVWDGWYGGTHVIQYDVGTLYLDFVDRRRGILAWQGKASSTLDPSLETVERDVRIKEAVDRIVAQFPPPGKAGEGAR